MLDFLKTWGGQSTTGQGTAVFAGIIMAWSTGQLTEKQAIAAAAVALVLVIWPQTSKTVQTAIGGLAGAAEDLVTAYAVQSKTLTGSEVPPTVVKGADGAPAAVIMGDGSAKKLVPLVALILVTFAMTACSQQSLQDQAYVATGGYTVVAKLEATAAPSLAATDKSNMKTLDNTAYSSLVVVENDVISGSISATDIATLIANIESISAFLTAHGVDTSKVKVK